jgi:hypothetical protein
VTDVAIIGLGSWGLCALERIVTNARARTGFGVSQVHVIEPGPPGSGVYTRRQPDYLVLNNPCGQLSLYPMPSEGGAPPYGLGLYEWASAAGYRWVGDRCEVTAAGRAITPHDFLPRRLMGEYLEWFYEALLRAAPDDLDIAHHPVAAIDIRRTAAGRERVTLAGGDTIEVDQVILTSGHTSNADGLGGPLMLDPYPVDRYVAGIRAGSNVGVAGMGLVGTDVVTALSVGRGGSFVADGTRLRYRPSGHEPIIHVFSRSGLPYCAKAAAGVDDTGAYQPAICTTELLRGLRAGGRPLDMRSDILPLIYAEMQTRFFSQHAFLADGPGARGAVRAEAVAGWATGTFDGRMAQLSARFGEFDPATHFFGPNLSEFTCAKDYESAVYDLVAADTDESLVEGGASPVKHAYEVLRILRDDMRSVVEFGGLSLPSYLDFQRNIRNRVHRLVAGPPVLRSQQLLALMDAGIVRMPFGPRPLLTTDQDGIELSSRTLARPYFETMDYLVRAHVDDPTVFRSASPLLTNLYAAGRLQQFSYDGVPVGSVDLSVESHPISATGEVEESLWIFGVLTEGIRYFNQYIPSPKSRMRAVLDMDSCINIVAA